ADSWRACRCVAHSSSTLMKSLPCSSDNGGQVRRPVILLTAAFIDRRFRFTCSLVNKFYSMLNIKTLLVFALLAWLATCTISVAAEEARGWAGVPAILSRIQEPRFAARDFAIADYGGVGDGKTDCKPALDKAIA